jgi:glucokinase
MVFDICKNEHKSIGVDVGGTKIAIAAVENDGQILASDEIPTEAEKNFGRATDRICASIERLIKKVGWMTSDLSGIGIGCAGPVNRIEGTINNPYTLPEWNRCNIVIPLYERFNHQIPVFLENDADAALIGEWYAGSAKGFQTVLMLTFGTGIGGSVLVNGKIYRGILGEHPEYGHIPVETEGPECYCGRSGCFESIASGAAMTTAGKNMGFADCREIFQTYIDQGGGDAEKIIERTLRAITTAAWTFLHTFMPESIIIGGGIGEQHFDLFETCFQKAIKEATMVPSDKIKILKAQMGNQAGVVGAAYLFKGKEQLDLKQHK